MFSFSKTHIFKQNRVKNITFPALKHHYFFPSILRVFTGGAVLNFGSDEDVLTAIRNYLLVRDLTQKKRSFGEKLLKRGLLGEKFLKR